MNVLLKFIYDMKLVPLKDLRDIVHANTTSLKPLFTTTLFTKSTDTIQSIIFAGKHVFAYDYLYHSTSTSEHALLFFLAHIIHEHVFVKYISLDSKFNHHSF